MNPRTFSNHPESHIDLSDDIRSSLSEAYVSRYHATPSSRYLSAKSLILSRPVPTISFSLSRHPPISLPENATSGESHLVGATHSNGSNPVILSTNPSAWESNDPCSERFPSTNSRFSTMLLCHGSIP